MSEKQNHDLENKLLQGVVTLYLGPMVPSATAGRSPEQAQVAPNTTHACRKEAAWGNTGIRHQTITNAKEQGKGLHHRKHTYSLLLQKKQTKKNPKKQNKQKKTGEKIFLFLPPQRTKETEHFLKEGLFFLEVIRSCLGKTKGKALMK